MKTDFDILRITHETVYHYKSPVTFHPHRLVLRPREGHDLRVDELLLHISPDHEVIWSRDIFGNSIATVYFHEPASELRIRSEILVRRFQENQPLRSEKLESVAYPLEYDSLEHTVVSAYLEPVFPEDSAALRQWLGTLNLDLCKDCAKNMVTRLNAQIKKDISYRRRNEKGVQSPGTTITLGSGSCRDLATLLMEAVRHLGFASRFCSGYLDCQATRAAHGVTHAWTEIYFPGLGWKGFDPTTGHPCSWRHVVTGVSNHPRGVMPVTGKYSGNAGDFANMTVQVSFSAAEATFEA